MGASIVKTKHKNFGLSGNVSLSLCFLSNLFYFIFCYSFIWSNLMLKFRIDWDYDENLVLRDIHRKYYARVVEFMKQNSYSQNKIYQQAGFFKLQQTEKDYEQYLMHCLRTECSVMAVTNDNEEVIKAVAILTWNTEEYRTWRAIIELLPQGKISQVLRLHFHTILQCMQTSEHKHNLLDSCLHIYEYCILPEIKKEEFMHKFFNAILQTARHIKMTMVTFLAMSEQERADLSYSSFEEKHSVIYSLYHDKAEIPFSALRDIDEMYASLHVCAVEPITPYFMMPPQELQNPVVPNRKYSIVSFKYRRNVDEISQRLSEENEIE